MPDRLAAVSRNLTAYRVMATIVGVLLVVLFLIGVPLPTSTARPMWGIFDSTPAWVMTGSDVNELGEMITTYLGVAHGWLYMIFLFSAFVLSRRARLGPAVHPGDARLRHVPLLSFWAEHRATQRVRAEHPELV